MRNRTKRFAGAISKRESTLVDSRLGGLFHQDYKKLSERRDRLVRQNSILRGCSAVPYLMALFRNKTYVESNSSNSRTSIPVHIELQAEFASFAEDLEKVDELSELFNGYVAGVLTKAHTPADICALMPDGLATTLKLVQEPITQETALTEEVIKAFREMNDPLGILLKQYQTRKLLLGE